MFTVNLITEPQRTMILTITHRGMLMTLNPTNPVEAIAALDVSKPGSIFACQPTGWFRVIWNEKEIIVEITDTGCTGEQDIMKITIQATSERMESWLSALAEWNRIAPAIPNPRMLRGGTATYSVLLLGESGVGKDAFVHQLRRKDFLRGHEPTIGHMVRQIDILTSIGPIRLFVISVAGKQEAVCSTELFGPDEIDGAIIMFDITKPDSFNAVEKWKNKLVGRKINVPTLIVGNKTDLIAPNVELKPKDPAHKLISVARNEGLTDVVTTLLRALTKRPTVEICQ